MYTITKEFHFNAAHMLSGLPDEHLCSRLHGHHYIVVVELRSETLDERGFAVELRSETLDERGFVLDYGNLSLFKEMLDDRFDHRFLEYRDGELLGLVYYGEGKGALSSLNPSPTTAENIARFFYEWCKERWSETWAVSVSETPKTWARYCPHEIKQRG